MTRGDLTRNDRFKARSADLTRLSLLAAVAVHAAAFLLVGPFEVDGLAATEAAGIELVIPSVDLPEPPADIPRPAAPVLGDIELSERVTIPRTDFDAVEPGVPAPPSMEGGEGRVRFIPYDTPPVLIDREEVARILEREYPARLRSAGVAGTVELWLYVETDGRVTDAEIRASSGNTALDEAALRVGRRMRFEPALNRDRPTAVWVRQPVTFRIR